MIVGGESAYKVRAEKDWVIAFHWVALPGEEEQPTAILRPRRWHGRNPQGCAPYAFQLADCYMIVDSRGYPTEHLLIAAANCCKATGTYPDKFTLRTIGDILLNAVEDLVKMPPRQLVNAPEDVVDGPALGEMSLEQNGTVVATKELTVPGERFH